MTELELSCVPALLLPRACAPPWPCLRVPWHAYNPLAALGRSRCRPLFLRAAGRRSCFLPPLRAHYCCLFLLLPTLLAAACCSCCPRWLLPLLTTVAYAAMLLLKLEVETAGTTRVACVVMAMCMCA